MPLSLTTPSALTLAGFADPVGSGLEPEETDIDFAACGHGCEGRDGWWE